MKYIGNRFFDIHKRYVAILYKCNDFDLQRMHFIVNLSQFTLTSCFFFQKIKKYKM